MAEIKPENAPAKAQLLHRKGIAALKVDNRDYAMDMFEAALLIEPSLLESRQFLRATAIQQTKSSPPNKWTVVKNAASLLLILGAPRKNPLSALQRTEKLLREFPLNVRIALAQSKAAIAAGRPEIAIQTLQIVAINAPPSAKVLYALAELYQAEENTELEYECREAIVRITPNDAIALQALKDAAARLTMGQAGWKNAESYRDVIRTDRKDAPL